ncbi:MAG: hypothetical protein ACLT75_09870 [Alistipes putredinis]
MKHQKFEIAVAGYDYRFKTYARDGVEASVKVKCFDNPMPSVRSSPYVERLPAGNGTAGQLLSDEKVDRCGDL